jgi:hypothetical protein
VAPTYPPQASPILSFAFSSFQFCPLALLLLPMFPLPPPLAASLLNRTLLVVFKIATSTAFRDFTRQQGKGNGWLPLQAAEQGSKCTYHTGPALAARTAATMVTPTV